uniref:Uncharacterized protein n=1 Tax=Strigamia maritima TaxID=126957 RepID=T1JMC7_STRMM
MWTPPFAIRKSFAGAVNENTVTQASSSGTQSSHAAAVAAFPGQWQCPIVRCETAGQDQDYYLTPDEDGDLPLHIAIVREDLTSVHSILQLMVQHRQCIDLFNNLRQTPLHTAVTVNNAMIVRMLLHNGANMASVDRKGDSALHLAVKCGAKDCLVQMLEYPQSEKLISSLNYDGLAPIHIAVLKNDANSIKSLASQNADIDIVDGKSGRTPLFLAVENNLIHMVELLVSLGASVNLANFSSITPLIAATDRGNKAITSILISRGAMISSKYDY